MIALILLATSINASDEVVETGSGVTQVDCGPSFCEYCGSSDVYLVDSSNFQVPGYLKSSSALLRSQISELSNYVTGEITVSISESWLCIQVSEFEKKPKIPAMYNSLLSTALEEKHHFIESFDISKNQTLQSKSKRVGSGADWEEIRIIYKEIDSDLDEIDVTQITETVNRSTQHVLYKGQISLPGGGDFEINEKYARDYYDSFVAEVQSEAIKLGKVEEENSCQNLKSPRGIYSIHYLAPAVGNFTYEYNGDEYLLNRSEFWADTPEFSTGEGVVLARGKTYLRVATNSDCYMEVEGKTDNRDPIKIVLEENDYVVYLQAGSLTLTELEELMNSFFFDFNTLLPVYEESEFIKRLYGITLENILFTIRYSPEASLNITGQCNIVDVGDCNLWGHVERSNSVLQSILNLTDIQEPAMTYLLNTNSEEGEIKASTGNLTYKGVSYTPGIFVKTQYLSGSFTPNDFYISQEVDDIILTDDLKVKQATQIQYIEPYADLYYLGKNQMYIGGDRLHFNLQLEEKENGYFVNGSIASAWANPYEIETLQVPLLWIEFETVNNSIDYFLSSGEAVFYCSDNTEACWYGQASIDYPPALLQNYSYSELLSTPRSKDFILLFLKMNPASSEVVFEVLYSADQTTISESIEFVSVTNVTINYKHHLLGAEALCFAEPCKLEGSFAVDEQYLFASFDQLVLAHGNVQILPVSSSIELELIVTSEGIYGKLHGKTELWNISTETPLDVNENNADVTLSGYLFGGLFNVTIDLAILITGEIETSPAYVLGHLQSGDLNYFTQLVGNDLLDWISKGDYVLDMSGSIMEDYASMDGFDRCTCKKDLVCDTPQSRVIKSLQYGMTCNSSSEACNPIELYCVRDTTYCMAQEVKCTEWYKNIPNTCKNVKRSCLAEMDLCLEYVEVCHDKIDSGCSNYTIKSIEDYEQKEYYCEFDYAQNLSCHGQCEYQDLVEDYIEVITETVTYAYYEMAQKLVGLSELKDRTIFNITKAKLDLDLEESGMGYNDLYFTFTAQIYSIEQAMSIEVENSFLWDFFDTKSNSKQLYDWARKIIIEESGGTLASELINRSALEVYFELF